MNCRPSQGQALTQNARPTLKFTAQQQQHLQILAAPRQALATELRQAVEDNPLLEEATIDNELEAPEPEEEGNEDGLSDEDLAAFYGEYLDGGYKARASREIPEDERSIEDTLAYSESLTDHLALQWHLRGAHGAGREIGDVIIGNLNEHGYLAASVAEIAVFGEWADDAVEAVLAEVQRLDPAGVAARDLRECLLLQLEALGYDGNASVVRLVRDYFVHLQSPRLDAIARAMGVDAAEAQECLEVLRHLDPSPGTRFNAAAAEYVVPDLVVVRTKDSWTVMGNDDGMPKVRINQTYARLLTQPGTDKDTRQWIRQRLQPANALLDAVAFRHTTLVQIMQSVLQRQCAFFDAGPEHLRPMIREDVARDIGRHVSTVARAVQGKYVDTPRGVFPLAFFFSGGLHQSSGQSVSTVVVKARIRALIASEDHHRPLSDGQIRAQLTSEGVLVSREAVMKYRKAMKIAAGRDRMAVA